MCNANRRAGAVFWAVVSVAFVPRCEAAVAQTQPTMAPVTGAYVQSIRYDLNIGKNRESKATDHATFAIFNGSNKSVTGYVLSVEIHNANNTAVNNGQDFVTHVERIQEFESEKLLHPGESSEQVVTFTQSWMSQLDALDGKVTVAIYDDGTAEVSDEHVFRLMLAKRKRAAEAWRAVLTDVRGTLASKDPTIADAVDALKHAQGRQPKNSSEISAAVRELLAAGESAKQHHQTDRECLGKFLKRITRTADEAAARAQVRRVQ